jgi:AraC family transcriptional regulator
MGGGDEGASVVRGSTDAVVRDLGDLLVASASYAPDVHIPPHSHCRPQLLVALSGRLRTHFPDRSCDAGPGDVLVHPEDLLHSHEGGPEGAEIVTVATGTNGNGSRDSTSLLDDFGIKPLLGSLPLARRIRRELTRDKAHADVALRSLALQLLVETARSEMASEVARESVPDWVGEAKKRLETEFNDQLKVGRLATQIGVTPMQLIRAFQRHYGTSPGAYLRQVRLDHALMLLADSKRSLAGVALEAGYSDQSHLCRVVKEETGLTPAEYRRSFQNG